MKGLNKRSNLKKNWLRPVSNTVKLVLFNKRRAISAINIKSEKIDPSASNLPKHVPLTLGCIPNSKVLWQVDPRPENSPQFYNFSQFTMGLNEMSPNYLGKERVLPPTDCRQRPDIRALENGDLEVLHNVLIQTNFILI